MGISTGNASWWETFLTEWKTTADFLSSVSGVLLLAGVGLAFLTYRTTIRSTRLRNTIDKISTYRHDAKIFQRAITIVRQQSLNDDGSFATLSKDEQRLVVHLINEWDELALCIRHGVFDEKLLYQNYCAIALEVWTQTRGVIRNFQRANPNHWVAFDWLAVRWRRKRDRHDTTVKAAELRELQRRLDNLI